MKRIVGLIAGVSGLMLTVFGGIFVFSLFGASSGSSVGIIGGADGPTAIFVAGNVGILPYIIIAGVILGIVLITLSLILLLYKKR